MTRLTTQQHHEVPGGTLKVTVETDHTLSPIELEGLEQIASACRAFGGPPGRHRVPLELEASAEVDVAIWELGGDQGISAG